MNMKNIIDLNEKRLLDAIIEALKIKSVKGEPLAKMPFGEGPARVLEYALNLADSFGLRTKNLDNYAGWAEWGKGDEMIGVLVHLDVVPEGSGWTYPPYDGTIIDGKLYGRGAVDNKGPAMAALFALKSLKDTGEELNKRIRIIFGTDEESGFGCIKHYIKNDEIPTMGFSPDAYYPIINCEKGILTFTFKTSFLSNKEECGVKVLSLTGGHRPNVVPDYAEAILLGDKAVIQDTVDSMEQTGQTTGTFRVEHKSDKTIIRSYGISAHGSTPEKGKNAAMLLVKLIDGMKINKNQHTFIRFINNTMGLDTTGKLLGINLKDEISGPLTLNVGILNVDQNKATATVNIRYPIKYKGEQVLKRIRENVPVSVNVSDISNKCPHYVPENNQLIIGLKRAYETITGKTAYCFSIGGGTYARMFDNCVAFGPTFPGKPNLAHQKDEYIEIEDLIQNLRIYTYVLRELTK